MLREASWSRSNFFWGTFRCKRPNATLGANSGFDQPSMIALASSRILELGARLWKGCRPSGRDRSKIGVANHRELFRRVADRLDPKPLTELGSRHNAAAIFRKRRLVYGTANPQDVSYRDWSSPTRWSTSLKRGSSRKGSK